MYKFDFSIIRWKIPLSSKSVDHLRNEYHWIAPTLFFWGEPPRRVFNYSHLIWLSRVMRPLPQVPPYAAHIIGVKLSTGFNSLFLQFFNGVRQKNKSCISSKRWPLDLWIHPHPTLQNCRIEWPGVSYGHYSQVADYHNWWRKQLCIEWTVS